MNPDQRWFFSGILGAVVALVGWILVAQAGIDNRQDGATAQVREESRLGDIRQDEVLERITVQQTETAAALREVAATLRQIDERGTQAAIRGRTN
jgi:hypothetical protein